MKILLIGKTGQLGNEIENLFSQKSNFNVLAPTRNEIDLFKSETMQDFVKGFSPEVIINTAAFHNVPLCETEWQSAYQVNAVAVRELSKISHEIGAKFITFSTDYVFSGEQTHPYEENDRALPLQTYGNSKLAGENFALANHPTGAFVLRTCGVYGHVPSKQKGWNFIEQRIRDVQEGKNLEISSDQIVSPTYAVDLAKATEQLIEKLNIAKPGIYHFTNSGSCSWYEFTVAALKLANISGTVTPVDRGGRSGSMRRPAYSVLKNTYGKSIGIELPDWQDALKRYLLKRNKS